MNGTWKPFAWHGYGQLSDVLCIDQYYQGLLGGAHYVRTNTIPLYLQATIVYATSLAGTNAAEPNPFRILLDSTSRQDWDGYPKWPFSPPETKRTEVYYALAGGAKGINYWWFKDGGSCDGLGGNNTNLIPEDPDLWKEIGLLGAEIKTLQPYLVTSNPVELDVTGSTNVWVRGLAVGLDTLSRQVRSAQLEGTLEALISTQTSIYTILIGNSLTIFLTAFFSATVLLFGGFAILRIKIPLAGYAASILILTLTFLAFLILGMLSASFVMIFKRGDPIAYIFGWSSFFLGGVLFPIEVLPSPLQSLAQMLPVTHAIKAIRELLLASSGLLGVTSLLRNFLLFTGIMAPVGGLFFRFAVKKAKRDGNLIQY